MNEKIANDRRERGLGEFEENGMTLEIEKGVILVGGVNKSNAPT